jgi:chromosomal replication initiation ATPase DnaA
MLAETRATEAAGSAWPSRAVDRIKRAVCVEFGVLKSDLEASRSVEATTARMVGIAIARRLTDLSLAQIGRRFGNRDHWTVLHACRRMAPYIERSACVVPVEATPEHWAHAMQLALEIPL